MSPRWKHFFARELQLVDRLLPRWLRRWRERHRPAEARLAVPARSRPRRRARFGRSSPRHDPERQSLAGLWRRLAPARRGAGALTVSAGIHLLLLAWIAAWLWPRADDPSLAPADEAFVAQVRLLPRPTTPVAPPTRRPEPRPLPPRPAPDPPRRPRPETTPAVKEPDPARERSRRSEASRQGRESRSRPTGARSAPAPRRPPRALGVGMQPPPLALGSHAGAGRLPGHYHGKEEALALYGGGAATESAVERGLRWLALHQDADGSWDPTGFARHCGHHRPCTGRGLSEFRVGVTGLAVLAFLGAGHSPARDGPYRRHVSRGIEFLLGSQSGSGAFGVEGQNYMYNHAIATFALSEAHGMARSPTSLEGAAAALRFSRDAQQSLGGWDYTSEPTGRVDLSITGWQVMAWRSASAVGVPVPQGLEAGIRDYLPTAFTSSGIGIYANQGLEKGRRGINMVAVGLLCHLYTGGRPDDRSVQRASTRLVNARPDADSLGHWDSTFQSYYHWYCATLCLFHLGGPRWQAWNHFLQQALLPLQATEGHEAGSWPPERSWIGQSGGRAYATAINVLTLEVYYRIAPLHGTRRG